MLESAEIKSSIEKKQLTIQKVLGLSDSYYQCLSNKEVMEYIEGLGYSWQFIIEKLTEEQARRFMMMGYRAVLEIEKVKSLIKEGKGQYRNIRLGWGTCMLFVLLNVFYA